MMKLFTEIWQTYEIPQSFRQSKLIALWKGVSKGSPKDPKTYRGLQIGSSLCKIMITIILDRLKTWYAQQLLDNQQGFRSGRGTADGIYITKRVQQITDQIEKPVYILFIDLSAAFDHVVRPWLFQSIYQRFTTEADTTLIKILEALYNHLTTALAETPEDIIELILGVRQGGPESPLLYNLFMDYVMRVYMQLCKNEDIKFITLKYRIRPTATIREGRNNKTYRGEYEIDWSGYADDLELYFEDATNMQRALILLNDTFNRFHLQINVSKTKTMIANYKYTNANEETYPASIINLNNIPVENVKIFRYLGDDIKFNEPSTGDTEIDLRISVAESKFVQLTKTLCNRNTNLVTRVYILNAMIRSRLTYSCQTWNINQQQMNRIDTAYMNMLRKMINNGYKRNNVLESDFRYVLSNNDILTICKTENILEYVRRQQMKYLAHIARRPNSTFIKRLLFSDVKTTKRGRPIVTLEGQVLEYVQMSADEFYKKALKKELDVADPRRF